ncbi:MAG TPA: TIGR01777 family oxidoreductase, partial [Xylanibacter oryzae]|nr:TIGR01777 family oxidoreductase [Xylanibacter oryzae]
RGRVSHSNLISYYKWDVENGFIDKEAFDGVNAIVNMTGTNMGEKRWTSKRKIEIVESRTKPIELLLSCIRRLGIRIDTFISSSAVGFYGAVTSQKIFVETDHPGNDFLASVCRQWETSALSFSDVAKRVVILRKGVVIGKDGGLYKKMVPFAQMGLNIAMGDGSQFLPWIDIRDLVKLYYFILTDDRISGIFNAVSTQQITMNDFSRYMLASLNKKSILPNIPAFLVKLMTGDMSDMMLYGSRVSNQKIIDAGFKFDYPKLDNI